LVNERPAFVQGNKLLAANIKLAGITGINQRLDIETVLGARM
jgi:hypothetical protein